MHLILGQHFCKRFCYSASHDHPKEVVGPHTTHRESRSGRHRLAFHETFLSTIRALETPSLLISWKHITLSRYLLRKVHHNSSEFSCAKYMSCVNVPPPLSMLMLLRCLKTEMDIAPELVKSTGIL